MEGRTIKIELKTMGQFNPKILCLSSGWVGSLWGKMREMAAGRWQWGSIFRSVTLSQEFGGRSFQQQPSNPSVTWPGVKWLLRWPPVCSSHCHSVIDTNWRAPTKLELAECGFTQCAVILIQFKLFKKIIKKIKIKIKKLKIKKKKIIKKKLKIK